MRGGPARVRARALAHVIVNVYHIWGDVMVNTDVYRKRRTW